MSDHGSAQLDLIRRYARTLREMHADAMRARGPQVGAPSARDHGASKPIRQAAKKAMSPRTTSGAPDAAQPGGAPTLPAA